MNIINRLKHLLVALVMLLNSSCGDKPTPVNPYQKMADVGCATLCQMRDSSGIWLIEDIGWWNSANQLTALLRYAKVAEKQDSIRPIVEDVFDKARLIGVAGDFINDYNDDEAWWLLAWIDAYNLYSDAKYLEMAEYIFSDLMNSYDDKCGGGIYWKKPDVYKNAVANNLFNLSALRLFKATGKQQYFDLAQINAQWFIASGMIESDGIVVDGLDKECKPKGHGYTYNSGVAIGWLTELYLLTADSSYVNLAAKVADAAIGEYVTEEGILKERKEPNDMGSDQIQFKGIFMRHLALLYRVVEYPRYRDFILRNADSIIGNAYDAESGCFGSFWNLPCDKVDAKGHSSAWEAVIEAYDISQVE